MIKILCELQWDCKSFPMYSYPCFYKDINVEWSIKILEKWEGYHGCNESTKGFFGWEKEKRIALGGCLCD